jgi:copper ion binding protein
MESVVIGVDGMSCSHCELTIQDAVRKLAGVKKVKANRRKKAASVTFDREVVTIEDIIEAIKATGYQVL